jgi:hypothetical protein
MQIFNVPFFDFWTTKLSGNLVWFGKDIRRIDIPCGDRQLKTANVLFSGGASHAQPNPFASYKSMPFPVVDSGSSRFG